jgi:hypothetical protein
MGDGDFNDRHFRDAGGGWFSWDLKVEPGRPQELRVTYWGSDDGRKFDVLVDGVKVKTEELKNAHPDEFYDETYPLTAEMLKGKQKITVKFEAAEGSTAGGVFGVRVMRK